MLNFNFIFVYLCIILLTAFIVATQVFYTIAFVGTLMSGVGSVLFIQRCVGDDRLSAQLTYALGVTLVLSGKLII